MNARLIVHAAFRLIISLGLRVDWTRRMNSLIRAGWVLCSYGILSNGAVSLKHASHAC